MTLPAKLMRWTAREYVLPIQERVLIMGVLNVTPDSFSDGGRYPGVDAAIARAEAIEADGADLLDIGGESSRPGAQPVSLEEELARVLPVVSALAGRVRIPISVDTTKAERLLGFRANTDIREGLRRTLEWYRQSQKPPHEP